ncbi:polyphosphate kinase 2 family protein [Deinococcus aquiradiocola]|uniref:Polyphosphate kinase n=1 Tax=Deinococcus aquiradiocola TaxID=393059 RepID=A0A917P6F3_9DEIO|nr:polyphosphate kinase 2 family protein [Deinococcus aquiradiocola]GGJ64012.1 polyphosphate kinase [Deinococcus aquiradiocola]
MKTSKYRVKGEKLKLSSFKTDETGKGSESEALERVQKRLPKIAALHERMYAEGKQSLLVVIQARDAGGKDGTVEHVLHGINPQHVVVTSFKVPSALEQAHDFLWRVHAHAPAAGMSAVFNRSHYEEVLVTRVHGQVSDEEAERRFEHIRAFEALLHDRGTRIVKLYLHISKDEQKERLQDRLDDPEKRWKFNVGDLKERALWDDYTRAYQDALAATSTRDAPWYVIPADHKWFRNDLVSQILLETLQDMDPQFPEPDFDPATISIK